MEDSERLSNAYNKAYTVYHRDIEAYPYEERDCVWDIRHEFTIGVMRKLRPVILREMDA